MSLRPIGGVFGLEPLGSHKPWAAPDGLQTRLCNGRSGIAVALARVRPERVVIPMHVCRSAWQPVLDAGCDLEFVPVDEQLRPSLGRVRLTSSTLVHLVDVFGRPSSDRLLEPARDAGATVLRDAAMTLWPASPEADLVVFSPRKLVGVVDGGVLVDRREQAAADVRAESALEPAPQAWFALAQLAARGRRAFDRGEDGGDWFAAFQRAEVAAPTGRHAMSRGTQDALDGGLDLVAAAHARQANHDVLATALEDLALFPSRPDGVVPSHFPILVEDRDAVRRGLIDDRIWPPIHWELAGEAASCDAAAARRAAAMLSLPLDQRYGAEDMERIAATVRRLGARPYSGR